MSLIGPAKAAYLVKVKIPFMARMVMGGPFSIRHGHWAFSTGKLTFSDGWFFLQVPDDPFYPLFKVYFYGSFAMLPLAIVVLFFMRDLLPPFLFPLAVLFILANVVASHYG